MPVKILFDYGVSQKMASYIAGENVLIISDPFLYQNGVAQRIGESLIGKTVVRKRGCRGRGRARAESGLRDRSGRRQLDGRCQDRRLPDAG